MNGTAYLNRKNNYLTLSAITFAILRIRLSLSFGIKIVMLEVPSSWLGVGEHRFRSPRLL